MRVVIAGGHGKIALILERLLAERGDSVAGAGPGSGAARKETVDRDAAILLADAAEAAGRPHR